MKVAADVGMAEVGAYRGSQLDETSETKTAIRMSMKDRETETLMLVMEVHYLVPDAHM